MMPRQSPYSRTGNGGLGLFGENEFSQLGGLQAVDFTSVLNAHTFPTIEELRAVNGLGRVAAGE